MLIITVSDDGSGDTIVLEQDPRIDDASVLDHAVRLAMGGQYGTVTVLECRPVLTVKKG